MKKEVILLVFFIAMISLTANAGAEIICNDTDGGKNYSLRGQVCIPGKGCILDDCMPDGLNERYCEGNESYTEQYTCPVACENGKCINGSSEKTIIGCDDSDGKGNYAVRGSIVVEYSDNTSEKINDICGVNIVGKRGARDYYCEGSNVSSNYSFDFEVCDCEDGICLGYNITEEANETEGSNATEGNETKEKGIIAEKETGEECSKDYECKSNLCIEDKCGKLTFFKKLIAWLDKLFGVERNY